MMSGIERYLRCISSWPDHLVELPDRIRRIDSLAERMLAPRARPEPSAKPLQMVEQALVALDSHLGHDRETSDYTGRVTHPDGELQWTGKGQSLRFSVVICTDGRAAALHNTLHSLRYVDYPSFEVCVVHGPTPDGTDAVLAGYAGTIKVAANQVRNLSISRNIGIALASADIVAFIDDDAIPEAEWLRDIAAAYADPRVGGAGGFVYDQTGASFQYRLGTVDRMGRADLSWKGPVPQFCFPFTANVPHLLGTNCSFRREALLSLGGFDEEFEYYLDETDLCCRLVDAGWLISQVEGAYVHHKFLPSHVRDERRFLHHWYSIIKNKIYFSLVNAHGHHSVHEAINEARLHIDQVTRDFVGAVSRNFLTEADRDRFWEEVDQAWRDGLMRGLSGERRLMRAETLARYRSEYVEYPRRSSGAGGTPTPSSALRTPSYAGREARWLPVRRPAISAAEQPGARRTYCLISQEYPPGQMGGIGRYMQQLARSTAALGHHVHVLTKGEEYDRVDFEDGVWVHRLQPRDMAPPILSDGVRVPQRIWSHTATMLGEIKSIARRRRIDCVYAPIWDCEGLAVLLDGEFPLVTSLQTTLHFWLESQPWLRADTAFMAEFGQPMLALEKRLLGESAGIHAISSTIAKDIGKAYEVELGSRVLVIPLGIEDWTRLPDATPVAWADQMLRLLFVGRLEARKGIDVLLKVAKSLLARHPHVHLDVVGNDAIPGPDGVTWRVMFEVDRDADSIRPRVAFHGTVDEARLRRFYQSCDVFVAPSRYESFGLVLVEAMMFAKPVVACCAGGMVEVVEDGINGLLAEPGDAASLQACLDRLVIDVPLRARLGAAGRVRYEADFMPERMATAVLAFLDRVAAAHGRTKAQPEMAHSKA